MVSISIFFLSIDHSAVQKMLTGKGSSVCVVGKTDFAVAVSIWPI